MSPRRGLVLAVLLACALVAGTGVKPAAAAHKPACWQVLLNDWYDGRIDGTYPVHCYRDALKHLPSDVETYSSARDDILRALASARLAAERAGRKLNGSTLIEPAAVGVGSVGKGNSVTVPAIHRQQDKGLTKVAAQLDNGGPSSIPLPLYILGGLALLLVALGGAGLVAKRLQNRRP